MISVYNPDQPFLVYGASAIALVLFCESYRIFWALWQGKRGWVVLHRRLILSKVFLINKVKDDYVVSYSETFVLYINRIVATLLVGALSLFSAADFTEPRYALFVWVDGFSMLGVVYTAWSTNEHIFAAFWFLVAMDFTTAVFLLTFYPLGSSITCLFFLGAFNLMFLTEPIQTMWERSSSDLEVRECRARSIQILLRVSELGLFLVFSLPLILYIDTNAN
jgi:hypothetical protein